MTRDELNKAMTDNFFKAMGFPRTLSVTTSPATEVARYVTGDWEQARGTASQHAIEQGAQLRAERDLGVKLENGRIRAALLEMKPSETPFSRGSYELERKAEMRLWEKMLRAVGE